MIDEDFDKWQQFLQSGKAPNGIHLNVKESSKLTEEIELMGIPRYLLIDKKGKIIDADAPSPSSEKLVELIKEHMN